MKKNLYSSVLISCLLLTHNWLYAQDAQNYSVFDGPHIFYTNDSLCIKYYDSRITKSFYIKAEEINSFQGFLKDSSYLYIIPKQFESPSDKFSNVNKIFVVSDIHGQYKTFKELLKKSGIIDQNNSWIWENGHLVILGDVFDRGNEVHEALWLIYSLEQQAKEMGGTVHFLLGNHEVMVLQDDLRYVHNKYLNVAESFSMPVPELYGNNTFWGRWIRSKNILTKIGSLLFVHGGIHPDLTARYDHITDINKIMKKNLDTSRQIIKSDSTLSSLFRSNGPIWYRGFFLPDSLPDVSDIELTDILNHFSAEKIIVGHTTEDHIYTSHNNRVICVDSGIKYGLHGEGLLIKDGMYYSVDSTGELQLIYK